MNGFAVDPAELRELAGKVAQVADELGEHNATRWFTAAEEVGHDDLAAQLREFQTRLTTAIDTLRVDFEEASFRLGANAESYEDLDARSAGRLR